MFLSTEQSNRIRRIVNEYHAVKVVIEPSTDMPDEEISVDFRTEDGTQMGVISNYGELTTYDEHGDRIAKYSD